VIRKNYLSVEDLEVYKKLCQLHIDVCELTHEWPQEEKYELGSQARRSSNSAPAQLAEKNDDRHIRNKIEGANRSRVEANETIHHLFMAKLKGYISEQVYAEFKERYKECIRMLNGLEKTLGRKIPERERRWHVSEEQAPYGAIDESGFQGWPVAGT
jgi:four helix bundle protein